VIGVRRSLLFFTAISSLALAAPGPIRFKITLDPGVAQGTVSGRLFVLMTDRPDKVDRITTSFVPGGSWISAMEIEAIRPGESVTFDPDRKAYPQPFSTASKGSRQFMALLDPDHSYAYQGQDEGDLFSSVVQLDIDPSNTDPVELHLTKITPARAKIEDTDQIKLVEFQSPLLTAFWGRPIIMHAGVVLPPSFSTEPKRTYPTVYNVHGFGGNHTAAWRAGPAAIKEMKEGKRAEMVTVFLDASFPTGHHVFADSVNNGPWGRALTEEFIPYLESKYRLIAKPYARFLTGHSSGGWSTLWLEVAYPDFFGGTWSTSPDSVTFKSFTGIDATSGSTDNAYRNADGSAKNIVRMNGKNIASMEEFLKQEEVTGPYGGQMASFDWAFSPRGPDGRPMKLFNRVTGEQDPFVQKYWEKYDIKLIVERNWPTLGPKLLGKVHIVIGSMDNFHLEEAAGMFCDFLKSKGREDTCEIVPGRDHMDLYKKYDTYPDGLSLRIAKQMQSSFEKADAEQPREALRKNKRAK
jgi:S-formylglutathione hydrolase FrmB